MIKLIITFTQILSNLDTYLTSFTSFTPVVENVTISGLIPAEHLLFSAPPGFRYMETDDSRGGISMLFIPRKWMKPPPLPLPEKPANMEQKEEI